MAQYIAFFDRYTDLVNFNGSNESCLFVGPITTLSVSGTYYLSPYGEHAQEVVTEFVVTNNVPPYYKVGSERFTSFMVCSEDIPGMDRLINFAKNGTRLISYGEYGFLNHVKYPALNATIGILMPNNKKVEEYLQEKCRVKRRTNMNPTHQAVVIYKQFDDFKISYISQAHSTPDIEIGQQLIGYQNSWFNYITGNQLLFKDDNITGIIHDAVYELDLIGKTLDHQNFGL
jgi:hypothetical protein